MTVQLNTLVGELQNKVPTLTRSSCCEVRGEVWHKKKKLPAVGLSETHADRKTKVEFELFGAYWVLIYIN